MIDRTRFLKEVCYVEDVAEAYKQHIKNDGDNIVIYGYPEELARYKWNRWEFQREHRFVLTALRGPRSTDNHQIETASCRERGCKDVYIAGVAGELKKKKVQ